VVEDGQKDAQIEQCEVHAHGTPIATVRPACPTIDPFRASIREILAFARLQADSDTAL
jgi:hypothetical protein